MANTSRVHGYIDMNNEDDEVFRERLHAAREARGLSQGELATRAGVPPSSISHFETGSRMPSVGNLRRLANALDVSADFLLGRVEELQSISSGDALDQQLIELTPAGLTAARKALNILEQIAATRPKGRDKG
jgi:transcriptional regulator with XRE-family HTH domain